MQRRRDGVQRQRQDGAGRRRPANCCRCRRALRHGFVPPPSPPPPLFPSGQLSPAAPEASPQEPLRALRLAAGCGSGLWLGRHLGPRRPGQGSYIFPCDLQYLSRPHEISRAVTGGRKRSQEFKRSHCTVTVLSKWVTMMRAKWQNCQGAEAQCFSRLRDSARFGKSCSILLGSILQPRPAPSLSPERHGGQQSRAGLGVSAPLRPSAGSRAQLRYNNWIRRSHRPGPRSGIVRPLLPKDFRLGRPECLLRSRTLGCDSERLWNCACNASPWHGLIQTRGGARCGPRRTWALCRQSLPVVRYKVDEEREVQQSNLQANVAELARFPALGD